MEAKLKPARQITLETRAAYRCWLLRRAAPQHMHSSTDVPKDAIALTLARKFSLWLNEQDGMQIRCPANVRSNTSTLAPDIRTRR